jgi:hypothetical protein
VGSLPEPPELGERGTNDLISPLIPRGGSSRRSSLSRGGPCTDLLTDPIGELTDNARWPKHLCSVRFLLISTVEWAHSTGIALTSPELEQWRWKRPLPIGAMSVGTALMTYNELLFNMVPFKEWEEALWALRIIDAGCMIDLFGLAVPDGQNYTPGELKYVVRGQCRRMFDIISRAETWWNRFRGESIKGRPLGTGTWRSADDFERNLHIAIHSLQAQQRKVTQQEVAETLYASDRQLRAWLGQYGLNWNRVLKQA